MSTATNASVSHLAYKKIVLHCAKYPSGRVFGFLVGSTSGQGVDVVDALPLSHHWTSLSPMAEAGLSLAAVHAASRNLKIVGLYEAPELLDNRTPSAQASKLTGKIASLASSDALLFLINNATLLGSASHSIVPFAVGPSSSSTTKGSSNAASGDIKLKSLTSESVTLKESARVKELEDDVRKTRVWDKLHDFDDHLENPTLDWLQNSAITA